MTYTGREATPGTILTVISFGLLLIVNLVTPIITELHLVKITRKSTADELTIGLWGYCAQTGGSEKCTPSKIGFAFDASRALNTNYFGGSRPVNTSLSYLLVVHIIALITLSIVTCVGALSHTRKNRDRGLIRVAAQSSALAFVFVLFAFIVDFILFNNEIVRPINKADSDYLAEFDIAYYLVIACLASSGLATISFIVGKVMNNRRGKPEVGTFDDKESDDFYSEPQMNEGLREQNQKFADFEEVTVIKQTAQFPAGSQPGSEYFSQNGPQPGSEYFSQNGPQPGSEYFSQNGPQLGSEYFSQNGPQLGSEYFSQNGPQPGSEYFPPNPPQPYPMGPYQGRSTSPSERPLPPQQFSYQPPNYPNTYSPYTNSNNPNNYRGYPQSSQQWG